MGNGMNQNHQIIPFGKYKGQPIEVLQADPDYCKWLTGQEWFLSRYSTINTLIINNFTKPEDTPEHNKLQAKFTDPEFVNKFISVIFSDKPNIKSVYIESIVYEKYGWDVVIDTSEGVLLVEIKPSIGDDYPSVLRQLHANKEHCYGRSIVIYDKFTATGVTLEAVNAMFTCSCIDLIDFDSIEFSDNKIIVKSFANRRTNEINSESITQRAIRSENKLFLRCTRQDIETKEMDFEEILSHNKNGQIEIPVYLHIANEKTTLLTPQESWAYPSNIDGFLAEVENLYGEDNVVLQINGETYVPQKQVNE